MRLAALKRRNAEARVCTVARRTSEETTTLLHDAAGGSRSAADELMGQLYDEFRALARRRLRREAAGQTLQPTALVNEVYLKLIDQTRTDWKGRTHFFAIGAEVMRRVLVDRARRKARLKRGGGRERIALDEQLVVSPGKDEDLLAVDEALEELAKLDPRQARIVELRFFGGLTVAEAAEAMGLSQRTVEAEWTMIRAWLRRRLSDEERP
jgi:RNA polymerase sigma factor (TIGR02999 family)